MNKPLPMGVYSIRLPHAALEAADKAAQLDGLESWSEWVRDTAIAALRKRKLLPAAPKSASK